MPLNDTDRRFLQQAMELAERGRGRTSPNPMVGALVVREGRVIGSGFHAAPGQDHAEVAAMKAAVGADFAGRLRGATMIVTLEPCCHQGRTPPCADALIAAGLSRVVVGTVDPSAYINGRGLDRIRQAGIEVEMADGEIEYSLRRQNDAFRKHVTQGLPFTTYKYAMTIDGRIATEGGHSRWISGEESRRRVHQMRSWSDAVIVGAGTLRTDDPRLTVRDVPTRRQPLRVVVDPRLEIPGTSALRDTVDQGDVLLITREDVPAERRKEVESWGVRALPVPGSSNGGLDPTAVARLLARMGVQTLLLEGGPRLAASWWNAGLIDRLVAFMAPLVAGGGTAPGPLPAMGAPTMDAATRLRDITVERSGDDVMMSGYLREPA